jgi:hypothetical protein
MVHQCPRCPLRFDLAPMLADHLARDHGARPELTDALQPPAVRATRSGADAGPADAGPTDADPDGGVEGSGGGEPAGGGPPHA